ncbi:pseudouridine synthase [Aliikangiella sp. IMCC44653]
MQHPAKRPIRGKSNNKSKYSRSRQKTPQVPENTIIIAFNKPYNTLCQFTGESGDETLADYIKTPGVYAAGRLDKDSEGLLILTNNGKIQHQISHPKFSKVKTYWVQVEGEITSSALTQLAKGVSLKDGITRPAEAKQLTPEQVESLWPRNPPVRFRQSIPTSWIALSITEGKNRQVRRMTAAVGFPTLRLIRMSVGNWDIGNLMPGESKLLDSRKL